MNEPTERKHDRHSGTASPPAPLLISARDLARILNVSPRTIWRLLSAGQIVPPVRIGGSVRWRFDEVTSWIQAGCPESMNHPRQKGG